MREDRRGLALKDRASRHRRLVSRQGVFNRRRPGEYSFIDSQRLLGIRRKAQGTRLRLQSSNGKTATGLVGVPLVVGDEPGAWEVAGGELMHDAIQGAMGKPDA